MFSTVAIWLKMGGYGTYVWSAYGIAFLVLIWNLIQSRKSYLQASHMVRKQDV